MSRIPLLALSFGLVAGLSSDAVAQSGTRGPAPGAGGIANFQSIGSSVSSGFSPTSSVPTFGGGGATRKPFTGLRQSAAVSPYINLFNTSTDGQTTFDNYNTLVRPQLNQQAVNESVNRRLREQNAAINQRVQSISAQNGIPPQGSSRILPTGHSTAFGFYSRYYPSLGRRRR